MSVVVSVYGPGRSVHLEACLRSLIGQTGCSPEVIVSEEYLDQPVYRELARSLATRYEPHRLDATTDRWSPGAVRNRGALTATGRFLVFLDCDIVCLSPTTISAVASLCSGGDNALFMQGPMVTRVLEEAQKVVLASLQSGAPPGAVLRDLVSMGNGFVGQGATSVATTSRFYRGAEYVALVTQADAFFSAPEAYVGREAEVWRPRRHMGTIALDRSSFFRVGGFCQRFRGWGWEDQDLIRKLRAVLRPAPTEAIDDAFGHLEHSHAYVRPHESLLNARLADDRASEDTEVQYLRDRLDLEALRT